MKARTRREERHYTVSGLDLRWFAASMTSIWVFIFLLACLWFSEPQGWERYSIIFIAVVMAFDAAWSRAKIGRRD